MLLVTDVTGPVGKAVLAELANGPAAVRAMLQPGGELPVQAPNIQAMHVDPADDTSLQRAMQGVEAIFLSWQFSPLLAEAHMRIVSAAKAAGVRRLVQLSGVGADPNMCCARMLRWYGQAEVTVAAAGLDVTRLRPSMLMQNLLEFAPAITQQGVIAGPFRSTKWTWVDARDVGAVAAVALRDPVHSGRTYTVTGSESLSYAQIAEHMTRMFGKPVRYTDITANERAAGCRARACRR